jgi:SAM-dependent methyltransferase
MAHKEQIIFVNKVKNKFPNSFYNKKVLGVGTFNVCGTEDSFFDDCAYEGIDLGPGPGVDIVCPAQDYDAPDSSYDTIISCECFEHNPFYKETIQNIVRLLKKDGLFLFTCATTGRPTHGTSIFDPQDSPFTIQEEDWSGYYMNVTELDVREAIDLDKYFSAHHFYVDNNSCDLYFWGLLKK